MLLEGFDASTVDPIASYEPLPAGWYKAVFTASEEKPTKAMTGSYLQLNAEVIEGKYQGRKMLERLNLKNPNSTAVEIANRTLSGICRAVGVNAPRRSEELLDKPFMMKLSVKPGDAQYGPSNEIKEYAACDGAAAPSAPAAQTSTTPPWRRG